MEQQFIRKTTAPDGIHDVVYFNEYRNPRWWSVKRRREWLLDKLVPIATLAALLAAYAIIGYIEASL